MQRITHLKNSSFLLLLFAMFMGLPQLQAQTTATFGSMKIGTWPGSASYGAVANTLQFDTSSNYALLQHSSGHTYLNAASGRKLFLRIANSNVMVISPFKRVGIGTANPQDALHIEDASYPSLRLRGSGYTAQLSVATQGGFYSPVATAGDAVLRALSGDLILSSTTAGIRFTTQNVGAASEKMTLTSAGNLGIGTTSPLYKLDVDGTIRTSTGIKFSGLTAPEINTTNEGLLFKGNTLFIGQISMVKFNYLNQQVNIGSDLDYVPGYTLTVDGKALVEELKVQNSSNWPDYVFEPDYKLADLRELESYVKENKHLPDVPGAGEVKDGVEVGEMQKTLLRKVEELTLYLIELDKTVEAQQAKIQSLEARNAALEVKDSK